MTTTISSTQTKVMDAVVRKAIDAHELPGLSIAVAVAGEVIFAEGYGMRNLGEGLPALPDTVYNIASVSKQFAAAALIRLRERGLISLDERPSKYLPWAIYPEAITLRHFLTHTSGIPDFCSLPEFKWLAFTEAAPKRIAETSGTLLAFEPGEDWQYCNTTYVIIGAIVEQVTGMPYHKHLQTEFFGPLGMTRTDGDDLRSILSNCAAGYSRFALGPWERAQVYNPDWELASGSLRSTVLDLVRWNVALRSGHVVRPQDYDEMTTPAKTRDGTDTKYGLGLSVADVKGTREVRHTGALPGFSTNNATYPDLGIDVVVFVNADGIDTHYSIVRPILAQAMGRPEFNEPRQPVDSKIPKLDEARVFAWARAAVEGTLAKLEPNDELLRFLTPRRIEALKDLARFGTLERITLFERYQRASRHMHRYRADFERAALDFWVTVRDGKTLEELTFSVWYPAA